MVNNINYRDLCISLLNCDTEKEVELLLKENNLLAESLWRPLGDSLANYSIAGNQQSSPVAALVEKLVNSIDAVLIDECWRHGINPKSSHAPNSMRDAVEKFFKVPEGRLEKIDSKRRTFLAQRIQMVATGKEGRDPSYTIIDNGEGQTPSMIPQTILSLPGKQEVSKSKIKFVQGLFNMGGTGVLRFSGQNSYSQLIISRRDPNLLNPGSKDEDKMWGFTIIRRKNPTESRESSIYEYLAPNGELLIFQSKYIHVLPGDFPNKYENPLYWGTCIKLYEYAMSPRSLASHIVLDLNYELSRHFQEMAVPIRLVERRKRFSNSNTKEGTLAGMSVRLQDDHASNLLENGYPFDAFIKIDEVGRIPIKVYVFNTIARESLKRYIGDKAIIFTINGQMHGHLKKALFSRNEVNLSHIADYLMLVLDCSSIDPRARERLFMASRDRLEEGRLKTEIEQSLVHLLKHNDALQTLAEKRREEVMRKAFEDNEPLKDAVNKMIRASPDLANFFPQGMEITKESGFKYIKTNEKYIGKRFPTFFRLKDGKNELIIECPSNSYCNIVYETDAHNKYFTRSTRDKGTFELSNRANHDMLKSFTLFNGIARLQLKAPPDVKNGNSINITSVVSDKTQPKKFTSKICVKIIEPIVKTQRKTIVDKTKEPPIIWGRSKESIDNGKGDNSGLQLPNARWVEKGDEAWERYGFTEHTGLKLFTPNNNFDLLINKDNIYLKNQIRINRSLPADLLKEEYKWGMTIACMGIYFHNYNKAQKANDDKENRTNPENLLEIVNDTCDGLAPIILPIISLSDVIRKEKEILIKSSII